MKHIVHNKLVRDKIPDIITSAGKKVITQNVGKDEYLRLLDEKLIEECYEYEESKDIEELADIIEVIYAIAKSRGSSVTEVEEIRLKKAEKRGAFSKMILLKEVIE